MFVSYSLQSHTVDKSTLMIHETVRSKVYVPVINSKTFRVSLGVTTLKIKTERKVIRTR